MKLCLYTDNHFVTYSSTVRGRGEKYSVRLENQIKSIQWVEDLAIERGCQKIICLGDFFDSANLSAEELTALKDIKWVDNIERVFLVGNHEIGSNDSIYNSTNALSKYGKVIDKPTIDCGFGFELFYLPYIVESNRKPLADYIKEAQNEFYADMWITQEVKQRIILSHNDIKGLQYGQFISKVGFELKEIYDSCSLFINGHLHNQTQINDKMLNLGNLTGQNFSEDALKYSHCAAILDTDTLKVELINNPYALNFYKFDFTTQENIEETLLKCRNGVVTAKVYESQLQDVKSFIKDKCDIIECRLISVADHKKVGDACKLELTTINHIEKFKEYLLKTIENTDILLEELNNL